MQTHEPHQDYLVEEFRDLARGTWGGSRPGAGAKPARRKLVNIERAAKLIAITDNPYMKLAFARHSTLDLMRICAWHLIEALDHKSAGKLLKQISDIEEARAACRRRAVAAGEEPEPEPEPTPDPEDEYELDIEAQPVRPAPLNDEEIYLRGLSDREIARQIAAARVRAAIAENSS